jgi:hypothetical protein
MLEKIPVGLLCATAADPPIANRPTKARCQPIEREKAPVRKINAAAPIMATPLTAPDTTKAQ